MEVTVGGTAKDMVLPAPALFDVSGTVSGTGGFLSPGLRLIFTSTDGKSQGWFPLDASGVYSGSLPGGNYSASVGISPVAFTASQIDDLTFFNIGSLSIATGPLTADFSIPATSALSGTIRGISTIPSGTTVTATDLSAPQPAQPSCCDTPASSFATADSAGAYQMILVRNRSYATAIEMPLNMGPGLSGAIRYPLTAGNLNLSGDTGRDFNVPVLPARAVIFGNVNDGFGHALANVVVTAVSQSLSGAANMECIVSGTTDIYGNYSLTVPSGNYQLSFVPPSP